MTDFTALLTSDLHLTDRARDKYRFGLFPFLAKQQEKYNVDATFILGDITDSKDRHSSLLVNSIVDELTGLRPPVYVLRGNHDGLNPDSPYFKFLNCIEGLRFIIKPTFNKRMGVAFVPHCTTQAAFDAACGQMPPKPALFLAHNTFDGAKAETGSRLSGLRASPIELLRPRLSYSGDVHVPQQCGPVAYVGAPYHVRFGDRFEPRVVLLRGDRETDLHFDSPHKLMLTVRSADDILNNGNIRKGDQVKIAVNLDREDRVGWQEHKRQIIAACHKLGVEIFGIEINTKETQARTAPRTDIRNATPAKILEAFCKREKTPENIKQAGLDLLEEPES